MVNENKVLYCKALSCETIKDNKKCEAYTTTVSKYVTYYLILAFDVLL